MPKDESLWTKLSVLRVVLDAFSEVMKLSNKSLEAKLRPYITVLLDVESTAEGSNLKQLFSLHMIVDILSEYGKLSPEDAKKFQEMIFTVSASIAASSIASDYAEGTQFIDNMIANMQGTVAKEALKRPEVFNTGASFAGEMLTYTVKQMLTPEVIDIFSVKKRVDKAMGKLSANAFNETGFNNYQRVFNAFTESKRKQKEGKLEAKKIEEEIQGKILEEIFVMNESLLDGANFLLKLASFEAIRTMPKVKGWVSSLKDLVSGGLGAGKNLIEDVSEHLQERYTENDVKKTGKSLINKQMELVRELFLKRIYNFQAIQIANTALDNAKEVAAVLLKHNPNDKEALALNTEISKLQDFTKEVSAYLKQLETKLEKYITESNNAFNWLFEKFNTRGIPLTEKLEAAEKVVKFLKDPAGMKLELDDDEILALSEGELGRILGEFLPTQELDEARPLNTNALGELSNICAKIEKNNNKFDKILSKQAPEHPSQSAKSAAAYSTTQQYRQTIQDRTARETEDTSKQKGVTKGK